MANPGMDWDGLMRVGLGELRMRPADFWALTPAELALMAGRSLGPARQPMTHAAFMALSRHYPDEGSTSDGR